MKLIDYSTAGTISSRQNPRVKEVCALSEKKTRERLGLFRFDGLKLLREALLSGVPLTAIYLSVPTAAAISEAIGEVTLPADCRVFLLEEGVFAKISEEKSPEGVISVAKALDKFHKMVKIDGRKPSPELISSRDRICFLSSVRDPGNLGTVLRTAAAFGVDCVLLSRDTADLYQPRTLRAAMGAIFRIRTLRILGEDADAIRALKESGRRVFATALDETALPLGSFTPKASDCFVIGNEGHGLSKEVISAAGESVYIPMEEGSESLNAAVAAAVCLWELRRAETP